MKPELEQKLVKKYPKLYRDYGGNMMVTCMCWGFSCGDGWYNIINNLSKSLCEFNVDVIADQVKEKFGGLRFYYHVERKPTIVGTAFYKIRMFMYRNNLGRLYNAIVNLRQRFFKTTTEKISDLVHKAEYKSYETCEVCGKPGKTVGGGWVSTLCDGCRKSN